MCMKNKEPLLARIAEPSPEKQEELRQILFSLGFTAKEHITLAQKLLAEPPKERFDRVVQSLPGGKTPQDHLRKLPKLVKKTRSLDFRADEQYRAWRTAADEITASKLHQKFQQADQELQQILPEFRLNCSFLMDVAVLAFHIEKKLMEAQQGQNADAPPAGQGKLTLDSLEGFARMPVSDYCAKCDQLRGVIPKEWHPL